jgi:hypothetical protein
MAREVEDLVKSTHGAIEVSQFPIARSETKPVVNRTTSSKYSAHFKVSTKDQMLPFQRLANTRSPAYLQDECPLVSDSHWPQHVVSSDLQSEVSFSNESGL